MLFADRWDTASGKWKAEMKPPTQSDAYELFDKRVRIVDDDTESGLVRLAIEWTDPVLAARWANLLVDRLNELMRRRAIDEAERSLEYLRTQITEVSSIEVQQALYNLVESQLKQSMMANVQKQFAFKVIDPAVAPDRNKYIKPKRLFIVFSGLVLGAIVGAIISVLLPRRRVAPAQ
jgi:uncharacterized protein involved in exopolysaccharide biosynthesis